MTTIGETNFESTGCEGTRVPPPPRRRIEEGYRPPKPPPCKNDQDRGYRPPPPPVKKPLPEEKK